MSDFAFSGGWLCLDFANTLEERLSGSPVERLNTYADLLAWSRQAGILDTSEAGRLWEQAKAEPAQAELELVSIKQARELIYRIFDALSRGEAAQAEDMRQFNHLLAETMAHARLVPGESGFTWGWSDERERLESPLWFIVRSAADLLTSPELRYTRVCASEDCGWLFLDTSKNHSRRWCDMKSCGNRAKARRHYTRKKEPDRE
jgi:predicted RNA-binding Zn ribbon-like protein